MKSTKDITDLVWEFGEDGEILTTTPEKSYTKKYAITLFKKYMRDIFDLSSNEIGDIEINVTEGYIRPINESERKEYEDDKSHILEFKPTDTTKIVWVWRA